MNSLFLHQVSIGGVTSDVGIFGCILRSPLDPEVLLSKGQAIADDLKVTIQLVNAERVASPYHLLYATVHALEAFHHGTQRANTLGMEILRFTAAQRQITIALDIMGLTSSSIHVAGVILGTSPETLRQAYAKFLDINDIEDAPNVLRINDTSKADTIRSVFSISSVEIEAIITSDRIADRFDAITKLVYERCALLSIEK